jgi:hypothetical protein
VLAAIHSRGTIAVSDAGVSKRQARRAGRERIARALEHPEVLAILLAHDVALTHYKQTRARKRRNRQVARQ